MCRICGFTFEKKDEIEKIKRMSDSLRRGGPDDEGLFVDKNLCLCSRRLSIIDLSMKAHQPMLSEDKNYVITYNGEIYNFKEIREELKKQNFEFFSESDTEVILKSYILWGEESFKKFNGMFAFAIFDKKKSLLYLVRDTMGIKPLYYSIRNGRIIFSSEIRGFKSYDDKWEEDERWRIYFLIFGFIPSPFTTLKDVFLLKEGHFLRYDLKTKEIEIRKYYDYNFSCKIKREEEAKDGVKEYLSNAVRRHLISDAPIGVFLSGGMDSTLIAILSSKFKGKIKTLSITFKEREYDETLYQKIVSKSIGSEHHSYEVKKDDFYKNLEDIMDAMDQPTFDGVNTYFISKYAKEIGLKSVLSGLGGDEIFGGYPSFKRIEYLMFSRELLNTLIFEKIDDDRLKRFTYFNIKNPIAYYLMLRSVFTLKEISIILDADIREINNFLKDLYWEKGIKDLGRKNFVSYLEMFYMKNQLLKDSDFMSMWNSVEIRVPFLDKELLDYAFSIDERIRFKKEKYLLKKGFDKLLPAEIIERKKQGFSFPMKEWLKEIEFPINQSVLNRKAVSVFIKKQREGKLHWTKNWSLFIVSLKKF